ncbi:hypothetical protein CLS_08610 [[Clostridium] cf. saccharolyticum K10]|nr:hypothetical protein CLS_08610 [[Clostridium] cf. saccharolyticum K10]
MGKIRAAGAKIRTAGAGMRIRTPQEMAEALIGIQEI